MSPLDWPDYIPKSDAAFCVNCEVYFWLKRRSCPACGGENFSLPSRETANGEKIEARGQDSGQTRRPLE